MKFLIILSLFLASQVVLANGSLSSATRYYLKSGKILKVPQYKEARVESLKEINSSPTLLEEARNLVEAEHGAESLTLLENILKAQEVADALDIELDANVFAVAQIINYLNKDTNFTTNLTTKQDLAESLALLKNILKVQEMADALDQEVADALDIELDANVFAVAQIITYLNKDTNLTIQDLEDMRNEIIQERKKRVFDAIRRNR